MIPAATAPFGWDLALYCRWIAPGMDFGLWTLAFGLRLNRPRKLAQGPKFQRPKAKDQRPKTHSVDQRLAKFAWRGSRCSAKCFGEMTGTQVANLRGNRVDRKRMIGKQQLS